MSVRGWLGCVCTHEVEHAWALGIARAYGGMFEECIQLQLLLPEIGERGAEREHVTCG